MTTVLIVCMQAVLAAGNAPGSGSWTGADIGTVQAKSMGTAQYDAEAMVWTVRGGGIDIYGTADSFYYVYHPFRGNGSIIARVESLGKTHPWAKAGVMIREGLDPDARFAAVYASVLHGVSVQARGKTAGEAVSDTPVKTREQAALYPPAWIKLERKGNQFCGYYATDKAGKNWIPTAWEPQVIAMPKTVYIGLALCSHAPGVLCEARFSNVTVSITGSEITEAEIQTTPQEALERAYENLEQLGNWRADPETLKQHGAVIASSLYAIARIRELNKEPAATVTPDYYRIAELLPETRSTVEALIRIAILDGQKGMEYARKCLEASPPENKDTFYMAVTKDYAGRPDTPERDALIESFIEYVAQSSRFTLLQQVIAALGADERGTSMCRRFIQHGMTRSSNTPIATVALRSMALKALDGQVDNRIQALLMWASKEFKDAKLTACATAALADTYYEQGLYARTVEVFHPDIFSENEPESSIVTNIESTLASYRANSLLQTKLNPERIYQALGEKAGASGRHVVDLHCRRKIAEIKGLSVEDFQQSAPKGMKYCESGPENEVRFWKGLIAAGEGNLGAAAAAYDQFLQNDSKSILAARAYYDIARTKMAMGEDAGAWILKAKALSPCESVLQLERRLGTATSVRN